MAKRRANRPEGSRPIELLESDSPEPSATQAQAATSRRARLERTSRPWLVRMAALPTPVIPILMAAMLFIGLAASARWAGLLLICIATFLSWLTALSWPAVSPTSRALRVVVDAGILALGVLKLLGRT